MKKSEIYHLLQIAAMRDGNLGYEETLEVLRELFVQEDLAKFSEEQEAAVKGE